MQPPAPLPQSIDRLEGSEPALATPGQIMREAGPAGYLAILALVLPPLGSIALFWAMAATDLGPYLRSHGVVAASLFALVFALLAGVAVLPTYAQCALAGWAFGFSTGLLASLAGFVGGALLGYAIAAFVSGDRINQLIAGQPKWNAVKEAFLGSAGRSPGFWKTMGLVSLLRFPPNSPFALTNLVMASVRVPLLPYMFGTLIGMLPRSALAVMIGAAIQQSFSKSALANAAPGWVTVVGIVCAVAVVGVVGYAANQAIQRLECQAEDATKAESAS